MLSGLRKICDKPTDWPQKLPGLLLSLHSSVVTTTGLSPAFMLFQRELHLPVMVQLPLQLHNKDRTLTEIVETTRLTDDLVRENTAQSFKRADKFYNRKAITPDVKLGQTVLLYDEHVPSDEMRKLHQFYRPVQIIQCLSNFTYKVKDINTGRNLPSKIYASRLKQLHNAPTAMTCNPDSSPRVTLPPVAPLSDAPGEVKQTQAVRSRFSRERDVHRSHTHTEHTNKSVRKQTPNHPHHGDWHPIIGLTARRRRPDRSYMYRVQFTDGTMTWLPARDIAPAVVRRFNASKRRRRT